MLEVNFAGPFALLPNDESVPYLLAQANVATPGVFLICFLYNQAHRIHFVQTTTESVASAVNEQLIRYFNGEQIIYKTEALRDGRLEAIYRPGDSRESFAAQVSAMMQQVAALRVFFAPLGEDPVTLTRIGSGVVAHLQRLGGRAAQWLENEAQEYDPNDFEQDLTVRFGRPAFIASLPDEMYL